jgi:hypothetical protein
MIDDDYDNLNLKITQSDVVWLGFMELPCNLYEGFLSHLKRYPNSLHIGVCTASYQWVGFLAGTEPYIRTLNIEDENDIDEAIKTLYIMITQERNR